MRNVQKIIFFLMIISISSKVTATSDDRESFIIEVYGDPKSHQEYIKLYHPFIEIVAVYEKLFNGLALKVNPKNLSRLSSVDFVKAVYPAETYEANALSTTYWDDLDNPVIPSDLNTTLFTGEGVKVAVIDTGIDYDHEDLAENYAGGYDLIDLDDDPMETIEIEGMQTNHGTHVAGIIAANGSLKGVAPDAQIYAYRALGPGGKGSSVHVIAAMEQAIKDGVDIMNLSLGNSVNGPDYPTSMAVNRAIELGTAVVIASGNDGPNHWSVGSPATASKALSVGASSHPQKLPFLYDPIRDKSIEISMMHGSTPWNFKKDYLIADLDQDANDLQGKIAITSRSDQTFFEKAQQAEQNNAVALLVHNHEEGLFQGSIENDENSIKIPVAAISKQDGKWLKKQSNPKPLYMSTRYNEVDKDIASFSSRGPVTVNWHIKPEILAPGTNVLSTVPGGYQMLQGTSMAAPHISGAMAVIKEARPEWTNDQMIGAIKTTAKQIKIKDDTPLDPIEQGMGEVQLEKAIDTKTILYNPLLSFGKVESYREPMMTELTIENTTNTTLTYTFDLPKKQKGLLWKLPQTFKVGKKEVKTIPIELHITTQLLEEGIHQGWLTLNQADEKYHLPYLFVNQTADYPKTTGFEFSLKPFSKDTYIYKIYVVEKNVKKVEVHLYDPDTLMYDRKLIELNDIKSGLNEGEIDKREIGKSGLYRALISVELENGQYETYEKEIYIE